MKHKLDDNRQRNFLNHVTGILLCLILLCLALSLSACNSATALPTHTPAATQTTVPTQSPNLSPSATFIPTKSSTHTPVSIESDQPCSPVTTGWQYRWQAGKLKLFQYFPPSGEAKSEMEARTFCARILANILMNPQYLDNRTVLAAYKQMLELPYIEKDIYEHERPFSVEKVLLFLI